MKEKLVVGYGVKFSTESMDQTWRLYSIGRLFDSKKEAQDQIQEYKKNGDVHKEETVKIFKVTMEII